jgi:hypothetical protein
MLTRENAFLVIMSSLSNLYIETGWEKLKDRRERHRTIQFYKMSNNLTPQYLSNLIPQNFGMIHDHNTRPAYSSNGLIKVI